MVIFHSYVRHYQRVAMFGMWVFHVDRLTSATRASTSTPVRKPSRWPGRHGEVTQNSREVHGILQRNNKEHIRMSRIVYQ